MLALLARQMALARNGARAANVPAVLLPHAGGAGVCRRRAHGMTWTQSLRYTPVPRRGRLSGALRVCRGGTRLGPRMQRRARAAA